MTKSQSHRAAIAFANRVNNLDSLQPWQRVDLLSDFCAALAFAGDWKGDRELVCFNVAHGAVREFNRFPE